MKGLPFKVIIIAAITSIFFILAGRSAIDYLREPKIPYHDSFAQSDAREWSPIGGDWQISDGAVVNRSDEHGAKLVTGSRMWKDYELSADLKLIGHDGDVGLMVRVDDEEHGVDSYNGYYVGLRSVDSSIVIGRADHGWIEGRPVAMPGGVQIGSWYRLRVVVVGCDIGAQATNVATGETAYAAFEENPCVAQGKIGLRSMATGGAWRNVYVQRATYPAFAAIRAKASFLQSPVYPTREDDYDNMRELYFRSTFLPARSYRESAAEFQEPSSRSVLSIATARASSLLASTLTLRGVVTLTSPLYIQDSTGGIAVQLAKPTDLNLGDEVEVTGTLGAAAASPRLLARDLHLLGDRTLVVPVSVTSTQAAVGAFDGRLVELRGTLRAKNVAGDQITLHMDDAEQTFRAVGRGGLSPRPFNNWEPGSELRIRGICIVGPWQPPDGSAFTVLLRSIDDVEVLSGPPWWSPRIIWRYIALLLGAIVIGVYIYLRVERWKMRAILSERERLAHEMHDTLAQSFAGVGFHLQGVRNSVRSGSLAMPALLEKLDVACTLVTHTHREASAEIAALHPDASEGCDILTALERITHTMLESGLPPIKLIREGVQRPLSPIVRDALFQIGREAIANILRHSRATDIELKLKFDSRKITLEVSDNGCGFSYPDHSQDFGIRAMHRRSQKIGGMLNIETAPGKGTRVTVQAPYGLRLGFGGWVRSHRIHSKSRV
jgi:Histidine kinase-, DNA gyrase B-, and HSP90-like ATPase/Histidine kinase